MNKNLLVTGIHREELEFGDRVSHVLGDLPVDVMRIPQGISHSRSGLDNGFYYDTQHREIYLQLLQQVNDQYRLLIDLHCGLNEAGRCADIYSENMIALSCFAKHIEQLDGTEKIRLVKILEDTEAEQTIDDTIDARALTTIPQRLWKNDLFTYVGLEIYLSEEGEGSQQDWQFSRQLIQNIIACNP